MKHPLLLILPLVLLAGSCSIREQETINPNEQDSPVFYASIETLAEPSTRAFVDAQMRVLWNADDRISIFNKYTYNQEYRFEGQTGDNSGSFERVPSDKFVTGNALDCIYAIYPYAETTRIDNDGHISYVIPATQAYREDSFGPGANAMVSVSEGNDLLFKNLCGYFAFSLYGDNVKVTGITLQGNNQEPLTGSVQIDAALGSDPALAFVPNQSGQKVSLTFDSPVTLGSTEADATVFWMVLPPTLFEKGITLTVRSRGNAAFEKVTSSPLQIKRNTATETTALRVNPDPAPAGGKHPAIAPENRVSYLEWEDYNGALNRLVFDFTADSRLSQVKVYGSMREGTVAPENILPINFTYSDRGIGITGTSTYRETQTDNPSMIDGFKIDEIYVYWDENTALYDLYNYQTEAITGQVTSPDDNLVSAFLFNDFDFSIRYDEDGNSIQWFGEDMEDISFRWEDGNLLSLEETSRWSTHEYKTLIDFEYTEHENMWAGVPLMLFILGFEDNELLMLSNDEIFGLHTRNLPSKAHMVATEDGQVDDSASVDITYSFDEAGRVQTMTVSYSGVQMKSIHFHYGSDTPSEPTIKNSKKLVRQQSPTFTYSIISEEYNSDQINVLAEVTSWYNDGSQSTEVCELGQRSFYCDRGFYDYGSSWEMDQECWERMNYMPSIKSSSIEAYDDGGSKLWKKTFVLDYGSFQREMFVRGGYVHYFRWYDGTSFQYAPVRKGLEDLSIQFPRNAYFEYRRTSGTLHQPIGFMMGKQAFTLYPDEIEFPIPFVEGFNPGGK